MSARSKKPRKKATSSSSQGSSASSSSGSEEEIEPSAHEWGLSSILTWPEETHGFLFTSRWIPEKPDHGKWYLNVNYQLLDNVRVGMDYRPLTNDASILANWRVFSEKGKWRPALIVGTSNDDFGGFNSQSYYATFAKALHTTKGGTTFSLYGGATHIVELEETRPVGGLHVRHEQWSALFMYSGIQEHFSLSHDIGHHTISFVLFDLELPGVSYSRRF
ncbi:hypothetical protein N8813_01445 [bacterium]|nr:hypothetical protein [bacterium]